MATPPHVDPGSLVGSAYLLPASRAPEYAEGGQVASGRPRSIFLRGWDLFAHDKMALLGVGIVLFMTLFSFVGPLIYRTDQVNPNLPEYACRPSGQHLLGCDDLGFDELGRLMLGGQASIEVGVSAAVVACLFGAFYGAFSGYVGGFVDTCLMRFVDAMLALPSFLLLIILAVIFHPNTLYMIIVIAAFYWFEVARIVRGEALSLRDRGYVEAVQVMGGSKLRAVVRHVMPNTAGSIIVQTTFAVADAILILAGLGYLGFGVQPPATDWGTMVSDGLTYINAGYWWLIYPPGIAIVLIVVAFNFIGDALRDAFETRLQQGATTGPAVRRHRWGRTGREKAAGAVDPPTSAQQGSVRAPPAVSSSGRRPRGKTAWWNLPPDADDYHDPARR